VHNNSGDQLYELTAIPLRGSATAPYETIAPGLEAAISKDASDLLNCFGARDTGRPFEVASGDLVCKVVNEPARGLLRVEGSAGVEFFARPGIQLGIRAANTVHYLFMPMPGRQ
jgi:hypothetical protein